jgi:uncharacterized protein YodC (DUF2158 family)
LFAIPLLRNDREMTMADAINVGNVVQVKSGGPTMTVDEIEAENAYCVYFDDKGVKQYQPFKVATLKKLSD